jgi:hypothetical protein
MPRAAAESDPGTCRPLGPHAKTGYPGLYKAPPPRDLPTRALVAELPCAAATETLASRRRR